MIESHTPITNAVLLTLLPGLQRLGPFLDAKLNGELPIVYNHDSNEYKAFLHDTLVAPTPATALQAAGIQSTPFPKRNVPSFEDSQNAVVDIAIDQTCAQKKDWFNGKYNVLTAGYRNSRRHAGQRTQKYHENSLETFVRSTLWETLLQRIGQPAMLYLLTQTSIFAALPNNCYCQITGPAISEHDVSKIEIQRHILQGLSSRKRLLEHGFSSYNVSNIKKETSQTPTNQRIKIKEKRKPDEFEWEETPVSIKRQKRDKEKTVATKLTHPPSTIFLKRIKIFYARRYQSESVMLCRFLFADFLKLYQISKTADIFQDLKPTIEALMKQIFPKQYGLDNVFSSLQNVSDSFSYASLLDGTFSSSGPKPNKKAAGNWRLRAMKALVEEMLVKVQKCQFKALLQYYCPVESIDHGTGSAQPDITSLLANFSTFDQVTSFVHAIVKNIIPLAMFGSCENRAVILRAMTRFIRLRKFETISLQYILQDFKLSECKWLQDPRLADTRSSVCHTPPTASDKQHEILYEFIYWIFDGFLIPLLQSAFYVTDSSYQRNKVFYYRHGLWRNITRSAMNSIQGNMFIKMEPDEVSRCNKVYSKVRFLPKTYDLRPIINLRRKAPRLVNGQLASDYKSINNRLKNAFLILAYERSRQKAISSAMGMSDLFHRLKQIKAKLVDTSSTRQQRLYMVKVDIKKSFDSINQENLLKIIDHMLKEDKYIIYRHSKVMPANGRMMKRFYPKAIAPSEMPSFLDFAREQAEISKHAVLVDKVVHTVESKHTIIKLIRDHIQENFVKFGKHYYRQTTGIPQGSILSPSLCRFFYDEMEKNVLSHLTQSDDSALVRLADDFLFISQCKNKATEFLETMSRGHPEYGCYINEHKTVTNFKALLTGGQCVQQCHENDFPYCGLLLNSRTLEIRADYSRYSGEDIRNLLTVSRDSQPSRSIIFKMKKAMQHTCQMAFSDTTHNSYSKVLLNIFQNFLFCAMKFHAYLLELFLDPTLSSSSSSSSSSQGQSYIIQPTDLIGILDSIFKAAYGLLHNGRRSVVGITAGIKFEVHERHVQWLGAQAFLRILPGGDNDKNDSVTCSSSSSLSSSSTAFISSSSLSSSSSSSSSYCEDRQNRMPRHVYTPLKRYLRTEIVERLEIEELKPHFRRMLYSTISDPRNVIFDQIRYK